MHSVTCKKEIHIGKVIISQQHIIMNNEGYNSSNKSTYIITGGLGGIGVLVAKYFASKGVSDVILIGRSEPSESKMKFFKEISEAVRSKTKIIFKQS